MTPAPARRRRVASGTLAAVLSGTMALAGAAAAQPLEPPPQLATTEVPPAWPSPPDVSATSYVLVEAATGQVLAERDARQRRPVASTVKVLTALTALARLAPDHQLTVPSEAARVGGASVGLDAGEVWTVGQLLDALIARSGNDAATALAIGTAGTVEAFVELMRDDARSIGLEAVQLRSPSGLDDANRLSALDLAVIARVGLRDPRFRELAGRAVVELPGLGRVASRNELLERYPGATGVKTGFTEAAGYALVASAARAGRELVAVVLDSATAEARFDEAAALLDYGFDALEAVPVATATRLEVAGSEVVLRSDEIPVVVPRGAVPTVTFALPVEAPGPDAAHTAEVRWGEAELATLPLEVDAGQRPPAEDGALVGRALVDRLYAGMRAATTTGAWDASASLGDARSGD